MQTKRKNKEGLIILGSLLVFIGLSMFGYKYYIKKQKEKIKRA